MTSKNETTKWPGLSAIDELPRTPSGRLPAYIGPEDDPLFYVCADGGIICPACANNIDRNGTGRAGPRRIRGLRLIGAYEHVEGPTIRCDIDICNAEIASAYGDLDPEGGGGGGGVMTPEPRRAFFPGPPAGAFGGETPRSLRGADQSEPDEPIDR